MDRHRQVPFQPGALRSVVKPAHGVAASAADEKPPHNIGEEAFTRASGASEKTGDVARLCRGYPAASVEPDAAGTSTPAAHSGKGGGLPPLPLHDHPQTRGACRPPRPAAAQD